jgi:hypothetical protein
MRYVRKLKLLVDFINNSSNKSNPFKLLMNCNKIILIILPALLILFLSASALADDLNWKVGDSWKIGVNLYPSSVRPTSSLPKVTLKNDEPFVQYRYLLDAHVIGNETVNKENCWKIQYTIDSNTIEIRRDSYCFAWISQKNSSLKQAICKSNSETKLVDIGITKIGNTTISSSHYGFPVEILRPGIDVSIDPNKSRWRTNKTEKSDSNDVILELVVVKDPNREPSRFIQTWTDGSNFWTEFKKYDTGYIELEAYVIGPWLKERFDNLYKEWIDLKMQSNADKSQEKYDQIIKLGIAAVPYMMNKIKDGDISLIPAVSEVTKQRVRVSKYKFEVESSATREEVLTWWEKNKERWSITESNFTNKQN